jgi:hypothetical protein
MKLTYLGWASYKLLQSEEAAISNTETLVNED